MAHKQAYYIIETGHKNFTGLNLEGNVDYKELKQLERERKLKSEVPGVVPRALLKHNDDMLIEYAHDEKFDRNVKVFKPEVVECEADSRGRLYFEKGQEDRVRHYLKLFRKLDKGVKLDESGLMLPEELPEGYEANRGGRPRKKVQPE